MKRGKNISCEAVKFNLRDLVCLKVPHPLLYRPNFCQKNKLWILRDPRPLFSDIALKKGQEWCFFGPKNKDQPWDKSEPKVTYLDQKRLFLLHNKVTC